MNQIEKYYNKFNEDKRLSSRHGIVEYTVTNKYIHDFLCKDAKIIDIGAGTGKYSISLANEGYDVTSVEYVKKNLSVLNQNAQKQLLPSAKLKTYHGTALDLFRFKDQTFDVCLLLGPMYHLFTLQDKIKALNEAKRITKKGGYIFVAYLLSDYAIIRHAIMDNNLQSSLNDNKIDENYNIISSPEDLYSYVKLSDIENYNQHTGLTRVKIFSPDGPTDYIRPYINKLSDNNFEYYLKYVLANSQDQTKLGASSHVVDVLRVD